MELMPNFSFLVAYRHDACVLPRSCLSWFVTVKAPPYFYSDAAAHPLSFLQCLLLHLRQVDLIGRYHVNCAGCLISEPVLVLYLHAHSDIPPDVRKDVYPGLRGV